MLSEKQIKKIEKTWNVELDRKWLKRIPYKYFFTSDYKKHKNGEHYYDFIQLDLEDDRNEIIISVKQLDNIIVMGKLFKILRRGK